MKANNKYNKNPIRASTYSEFFLFKNVFHFPFRLKPNKPN
jgi:hypothetical protein